ncbi:MAG: glycosyltransferase family 2 protein, partial [Crenarchaeota archaeon]|nr:glycosyltransferase family 2 protein [Thermoproteota archaeon]
MVSKKLVSVIIVNYNGQCVLEKCVQSVFDSTYSPIEVIIVDNSPTDRSAEEVSRKYPIVLIKNNRNLGFSAGNNIGLLAAKGSYVLVLNNDAILRSDAIAKLMFESMKSPMEILQPKILLIDEPQIINSTGMLIHFAGFGLLRGCGERDLGQYDCSPYVCAPHGACFLAPRSVLNEIGLFDDNFFAFCEDTDFGLRASLTGKKIRYIPTAVAYHKWGNAYNKTNLYAKLYLSERNRLIILLTSFQRSTIIHLLPIIVLTEFCTLLYCTTCTMIKSKIKGYTDLILMRRYLIKRRQWIQSMRQESDDYIMELLTCEFKHIHFGKANTPINALFSL